MSLLTPVTRLEWKSSRVLNSSVCSVPTRCHLCNAAPRTFLPHGNQAGEQLRQGQKAKRSAKLSSKHHTILYREPRDHSIMCRVHSGERRKSRAVNLQQALWDTKVCATKNVGEGLPRRDVAHGYESGWALY